MSLHPDTILIHGGTVALLASALVLGALRFNPRLFLKHFPDRVRSTQRPLSDREKVVGYGFAVALFVVLVGGPVASTFVIASGKGVPHDPLSLWAHAALVSMVFNVVDWLVIDEVLLGLGKPRWALPAGVSMSDVEPFEHGRHFFDFIKGTIGCVLVGVLASGLAIVAAALGWFEGSQI